MLRRRAVRPASAREGGKLYTLQVFILNGPVTEEFAGQEISRTIQIRGDQTLETLHRAVFRAFDREDEHLYEFNLGEGPHDLSSLYVLRDLADDYMENRPLGHVEATTLDDLGLEAGRAFGYRFDFGDDWLHQINVVAVEEARPSRGYPKVIARVGASPPQYPDLDDEDGEEDDP